MNNLLKPITEHEFNSIVSIQVNAENIEEKFERYTYGFLDVFDHLLSCDEADEYLNYFLEHNLKYEDRYIEFFKKVYEFNKSQPIVAEIYLNELSNIEILSTLNILDFKDKLLFLELIRHCTGSSHLFLVQSEEILLLLVRLSTREQLFSTLYFTKIPASFLGNFDLSFPTFFQNINDASRYLEIARSTDLFLRDIKTNQ